MNERAYAMALERTRSWPDDAATRLTQALLADSRYAKTKAIVLKSPRSGEFYAYREGDEHGAAPIHTKLIGMNVVWICLMHGQCDLRDFLVPDDEGQFHRASVDSLRRSIRKDCAELLGRSAVPELRITCLQIKVSLSSTRAVYRPGPRSPIVIATI